MRNRITALILAGALAVSPGIALAEESSAAPEELITNSAHFAADHTALAKNYRGKAAIAEGMCEVSYD